MGNGIDIREKMRRDWDRRARVDPRYWVAATSEADEASYEASADRDTRALIDGLAGKLGPEARVLDLGCGIGRLAVRLAEHFAEVVGVDVSPEMIATARSLYGERENLRFSASSGTDLAAFPDGRFDLVVSYSVLPHLPLDVVETYFSEVGRVLRPGGWFRYQFWVGRNETAADNDTLSIRTYDEPTFQRLNRDGGLEIADVDPIDYFDPVLKLNPVWVNAQRRGTPRPLPAALTARAASPTQKERELEYGLLLYLAVKHRERGEGAAAERVLAQAVETDPHRAEAYVQWATHRLEADDTTAARALFERLTETVPGCAEGWLYLAQCNEVIGDLDAARAALSHLDGLPDSAPALREQADALRSLIGPAPERKPPGRARRRRRTRKKKR